MAYADVQRKHDNLALLQRSTALAQGSLDIHEMLPPLLDHAREMFHADVAELLLWAELGGVESLIGHPATMTHAAVPVAMRQAMGLTESLIRAIWALIGAEPPTPFLHVARAQQDQARAPGGGARPHLAGGGSREGHAPLHRTPRP